MDLVRAEHEGVATHVATLRDGGAAALVAFSERSGGVSDDPYSSLNLAAHVGDDPARVDENRARLLRALGLGGMRDALTTAEQVHGTNVVEITSDLAGCGAHARGIRPPVPACDAMWTRLPGVPLLMLYADCVPVVLVRPSVPAVAVVHAGWRGAAAGVVGRAARVLGALDGEDDLRAFVGPHIGGCCYVVGPDCVSHFDTAFVTITATGSHLDLGAVVADELKRSGIPKERQWPLGICTSQSTDRFFSYRANGQTGRHGALAVIL